MLLYGGLSSFLPCARASEARKPRASSWGRYLSPLERPVMGESPLLKGIMYQHGIEGGRTVLSLYSRVYIISLLEK
ncbi:hypothetical protein BJ166DRAFT_193092 [Pestalotiopsis sp. NC0098]|nr:hypothetical protein BJ166DRAFT_193092 [Pestalotiopsis sp. NC0098]